FERIIHRNTGKIPKTFYDFSNPVCSEFNFVNFLEKLFIFYLQIFQKHPNDFYFPLNNCQWIIYFMGHAACHFTKRSHFRRMDQLDFTELQLFRSSLNQFFRSLTECQLLKNKAGYEKCKNI